MGIQGWFRAVFMKPLDTPISKILVKSRTNP